MSLPTAPQIPVLPGAFVNLLADVLARWQIRPEQLLDGSGLSQEQLDKPFWYVDFKTFNWLLERAVSLTGEPGIGVHMGLQMTVTCMGMVGFAAMVAKDIQEGVGVVEQFASMRCPALVLHLEEHQGMAYLELRQPLPEYQLHETGVIFLLAGIAQIGSAVTGKVLNGFAEATFPQPESFESLRGLLPGEINFGQRFNRVVFPASYLELPLVMADPFAARMAREQCKRMLNTMMGSKGSVAGLVRDLVFDEAQGFCCMAEVAEKLHISERTLQRQLAGEGQSFKGIVEALREEKAAVLLRQGSSVSQVAERLGYADVSNFTRAFKRWQGRTPRQYRTQDPVACRRPMA